VLRSFGRGLRLYLLAEISRARNSIFNRIKVASNHVSMLTWTLMHASFFLKLRLSIQLSFRKLKKCSRRYTTTTGELEEAVVRMREWSDYFVCFGGKNGRETLTPGDNHRIMHLIRFVRICSFFVFWQCFKTRQNEIIILPYDGMISMMYPKCLPIAKSSKSLNADVIVHILLFNIHMQPDHKIKTIKQLKELKRLCSQGTFGAENTPRQIRIGHVWYTYILTCSEAFRTKLQFFKVSSLNSKKTFGYKVNRQI